MECEFFKPRDAVWYIQVLICSFLYNDIMTETLHIRFYHGTAPYYPHRASTKKNVVVWVAFLPVLGL